MDLEQHMMRVLNADSAHAVSMAEFARQFGVSSGLVTPVAQRMVDDGRVVGATGQVRGVTVLRSIRLRA